MRPASRTTLGPSDERARGVRSVRRGQDEHRRGAGAASSSRSSSSVASNSPPPMSAKVPVTALLSHSPRPGGRRPAAAGGRPPPPATVAAASAWTARSARGRRRCTRRRMAAGRSAGHEAVGQQPPEAAGSVVARPGGRRGCGPGTAGRVRGRRSASDRRSATRSLRALSVKVATTVSKQPSIASSALVDQLEAGQAAPPPLEAVRDGPSTPTTTTERDLAGSVVLEVHAPGAAELEHAPAGPLDQPATARAQQGLIDRGHDLLDRRRIGHRPRRPVGRRHAATLPSARPADRRRSGSGGEERRLQVEQQRPRHADRHDVVADRTVLLGQAGEEAGMASGSAAMWLAGTASHAAAISGLWTSAHSRVRPWRPGTGRSPR